MNETTAHQALTTELDCTLDGRPVLLSELPLLPSDALARIVGYQEPGSSPLDARDYDWSFTVLPTHELEHANEHGEAPDGGWCAAHKRHLAADLEAIRNGSPEYAGRGAWLKDVWGANTAIYPLFVVLQVEDGEEEYRLWDGHRRLAGAFFYGIEHVAVLLGTPKM